MTQALPAALVTCGRIDRIQRRPQSQSAIPNRKQRRAHPQIPQAPQHTRPTLRALTIAKLHTQQLLHSVLPCSHHAQQRRLLPVHSGSQVHTVCPDVCVPVLVKPPASPRPILRLPTLLQPHYRVRTQRGRLSHQFPKHRLEVSGGQSLQVQLPKQILRLTTRALISPHYLRLEATRRHLSRHVPHPRHLHLHRRNSHRQLTTAVITVSVSAKLIASLIATPAQKSVHFLFERGRQHPSRSFPGYRFQRVLNYVRVFFVLIYFPHGVLLQFFVSSTDCVTW